MFEGGVFIVVLYGNLLETFHYVVISNKEVEGLMVETTSGSSCMIYLKYGREYIIFHIEFLYKKLLIN